MDALTLKCIALAERSSTPTGEANAAAVKVFERLRANGVSLTDMISNGRTQAQYYEPEVSPESVVGKTVRLSIENYELKEAAKKLEDKFANLQRKCAKLEERVEHMTLRRKKKNQNQTSRNALITAAETERAKTDAMPEQERAKAAADRAALEAELAEGRAKWDADRAKWDADRAALEDELSAAPADTGADSRLVQSLRNLTDYCAEAEARQSAQSERIKELEGKGERFVAELREERAKSAALDAANADLKQTSAVLEAKLEAESANSAMLESELLDVRSDLEAERAKPDVAELARVCLEKQADLALALEALAKTAEKPAVVAPGDAAAPVEPEVVYDPMVVAAAPVEPAVAAAAPASADAPSVNLTGQSKRSAGAHKAWTTRRANTEPKAAPAAPVAPPNARPPSVASRVLEILKANPGIEYTAKQLADMMIAGGFTKVCKRGSLTSRIQTEIHASRKTLLCAGVACLPPQESVRKKYQYIWGAPAPAAAPVVDPAPIKSETSSQANAAEAPAKDGWEWGGIFVPNGTQATCSYNRQVVEAVVRNGLWVVGEKEFPSAAAAASAHVLNRKGEHPRLNGVLNWWAIRPGDNHWELLHQVYIFKKWKRG